MLISEIIWLQPTMMALSSCFRIWDASTGVEVSKYVEHEKRAWSVDFSRLDPMKLARGSDDCTVRIWSIKEVAAPALQAAALAMQEFHRLRSSLGAKQEHASLLEDFRQFDRSKLDLEQGDNLEEQVLLKERASISRNMGQVNNILASIKRKKSVDTIVLSLVASVRTFLILIYWLTK